MKKIIIFGLMFVLVASVLAITLPEMDNSAHYLKDEKGDRIVDQKKDRCISYVNVTTVVDVYEQLDYTEAGLGILDGEVIRQESGNITKEVWYPCEYADDPRLDLQLESKRQKIIKKEMAKVEEGMEFPTPQ